MIVLWLALSAQAATCETDLTADRNARLWSGWHIATSSASVHFVGDTAYDPEMFTSLRRHLGAPDLALVPIGAYAPRWFMHAQHCDPSEAVQIHLDLGARRSLGMHWGCFPLTDEPHDEPPAALARAAHAAGLPDNAFTTVAPGLHVPFIN